MNIAIIDTETNYRNEVISIGVVIADIDTFQIIEKKYYVIYPECTRSAMYSSSLYLQDAMTYLYRNKRVFRKEAIHNLIDVLEYHRVYNIFAYNAGFDKNCLWELQEYDWYDILKVAAYKNTNPYIHESMECCKSGRLKRGYGVESMLRLMSQDFTYQETHNGLLDAIDEFEIMKYLNYSLEGYIHTKV